MVIIIKCNKGRMLEIFSNLPITIIVKSLVIVKKTKQIMIIKQCLLHNRLFWIIFKR